MTQRAHLAALLQTEPAAERGNSLGDAAASRRRRTNIALLAVSIALACDCGVAGAASASSSSRCRGAGLRPRSANTETVAKATLCLLNKIRRANRLHTLRMSRALRRIAADQSHDMSVGDYFGDNSLSGLTPLQRVHISSYGRSRQRLSVGQAIAWGNGREATPTAIVRAWMHSAPHRAILLRARFRDVGVGVSTGPRRSTRVRGAATYTVDLAS